MFAIILFLWADCVMKNSMRDKKYFFMLEKNNYLCYTLSKMDKQENYHGKNYE